MDDNFAIQLFEGKRVRIVWDPEQEKYYFSVVDIVQVLTDSADAKQYIKKMRARDPELDSKWGTICTPVEMRAFDGKEWHRAGITEQKDFAILTNVLTQAWSGMTTGEYKRHKGLTKENLRDNMTNVELALNTLAEVTATEISRQRNPKGMAQSRQTAKEGGEVARNARADIESRLGHSVISSERASDHIRPIEEKGKAKELPFEEKEDK